jgi:hypothetical protein
MDDLVRKEQEVNCPYFHLLCSRFREPYNAKSNRFWCGEKDLKLYAISGTRFAARVLVSKCLTRVLVPYQWQSASECRALRSRP